MSMRKSRSDSDRAAYVGENAHRSWMADHDAWEKGPPKKRTHVKKKKFIHLPGFRPRKARCGVPTPKKGQVHPLPRTGHLRRLQKRLLEKLLRGVDCIGLDNTAPGVAEWSLRDLTRLRWVLGRRVTNHKSTGKGRYPRKCSDTRTMAKA